MRDEPTTDERAEHEALMRDLLDRYPDQGLVILHAICRGAAGALGLRVPLFSANDWNRYLRDLDQPGQPMLVCEHCVGPVVSALRRHGFILPTGKTVRSRDRSATYKAASRPIRVWQVSEVFVPWLAGVDDLDTADLVRLRDTLRLRPTPWPDYSWQEGAA